jgi:large subunit ribosomal protein L25
MSDINLEIQTRDPAKEKCNRLRNEGLIPCVVYGHGKGNMSIKISEKELHDKLHDNYPSNIFIDLKFAGQKDAPRTVLIKEVQRACISQNVLHIDFMEINPKEKISTHVPVKLVGDAPGEISEGGILEFLLRMIDVECLPRNMPREIEVDISELHTGESIGVGDLEMPEDVRVLNPEDAVIVAVVERREAEAEKTAEEAEAAAMGEAGEAAEAEEAKTAE